MLTCFSAFHLRTLLIGLTVSGLGASLSQAAYVQPMIAGGQSSGPMIHADIYFDGTALSYTMMRMDHGHGGGHGGSDALIPMLEALQTPDQFDPAAPWSVLAGKAYNFQYAWNPDPRSELLPQGASLWIERLHHDSGLEAFWRESQTTPYAAIFEENGDLWRWDGAMAHNTYAVASPIEASYEALYRLYLGDSVTGVALQGYADLEVRWTWSATPEDVSGPHPHPVPTPAAAAGILFGGLILGCSRRTARG